MPSNCSATPTRLCSSVSWISRLSRARSASTIENWRRTSPRSAIFGKPSSVNELNVAIQLDLKGNHAAYQEWTDNISLKYW